MVGLKINGYKYDYFTIKQTAHMLRVSESSIRNFIDRDWLDNNGISHEPEDILLSPGHRKYISDNLIDNISHKLWVPVG